MAVMTRFPRLSAAERQARIQWWSAGLLRAIARSLRLDLPLPEPQALLADGCADGAFDALNLLRAARALDGGSATDQRRAAQMC
jgi:hypothetical protein